MRDWITKSAIKAWLPGVVLSFTLMAAGCRSTSKVSSGISPDLTTSSESAPPPTELPKWQPTTFVDRAELQAGTGTMDPDAELEFSTTESGLRYRVLRKSDGKKPTADSTVSVHYRGWLHPGKVFDSSYERGEPTTFPLRGVIAGWTEGMQLVGEGGMIELWVPSKLGYGERGSPGSIPAHSNLHFIVELVDVE